MTFSRSVTNLLAAIWLVNGVYCKILNQVPRHQQIVGEILGDRYAREITVLIGIAELIMAFWILSRWKPIFAAIVQIILIACMNTVEFFLVPELLLWGRFNALFALLLILLIAIHTFYAKPKPIPAR